MYTMPQSTIMTPEQIVASVLAPPGRLGRAIRDHLAPDVVEDLEQALALAIREDRQQARQRLRNLARDLQTTCDLLATSINERVDVLTKIAE